ncbi:MAG: hypothetical protein J6F30_11240 [Cellulosilyticum sp.]|nr:hypothetical protein [Cellulosilyticum sp.]
MDGYVIVEAGTTISFEVECRSIAKVVPEKSLKLYQGGLVVEDGTPYHILDISQGEDETTVTLIFHDHYQIHYKKNGPVLYTSDENYVDEK